MKKEIITFLLIGSSLLAAPLPFEGDHKIRFQNSILTQVNGTTISVMDVKKKLDFAFHQNYPHLADSTAARFQFYQTGWRQAFMEMIDQELMLADAAEREIQVTDGEVREELENRFGPNVMMTLDRIGLTPDEAWKMIKNEMIVQRMAWFNIHAKAIAAVTPQELKKGYQSYLKQNPAYQDVKYRVVSIRHENLKVLEALSEEVHALLVASGKPPQDLSKELEKLEKQYPSSSIQVSTEYAAKNTELSESHRKALESLSPKQYGQPTVQTSRVDKKTVARIFHLEEKIDHPAPSFDQMSMKIKNELLQKATAVEGSNYINKLRNRYGYDATHLKDSVPDELNPFSIE